MPCYDDRNLLERQKMLTEKQVEEMTARIPEDCVDEDRRAAYCVIHGTREGYTAKHIASYYSLPMSLVEKWFDFFKVENTNSEIRTTKRGNKSKNLQSFVELNIGRTVTPKEVSDELGISLPTFYNFYNANRALFKKVTRGKFEIINPDSHRELSE